jgi:DNA modification methylase
MSKVEEAIQKIIDENIKVNLYVDEPRYDRAKGQYKIKKDIKNVFIHALEDGGYFLRNTKGEDLNGWWCADILNIKNADNNELIFVRGA